MSEFNPVLFEMELSSSGEQNVLEIFLFDLLRKKKLSFHFSPFWKKKLFLKRTGQKGKSCFFGKAVFNLNLFYFQDFCLILSRFSYHNK